MAYLYTTPAEEREMLSTIGVPSIESLFDGIPAELRLDRLLNLPPALSELELEARMTALARKNVTGRERVCFLGGGAYDHFIPAAVDAVAGRSEFYTAYTPYQAEASQGSLQTFFEFQTMVCELAGLDVANASLYEGGTGLSEAVFMSQRINDRFGKVVVLGSVHPEYRQVLETYLNTSRTELVTIPTPGGLADLDRVAAAIDDTTTCLVFQTPNYFGCLEEGRALVELAHARGSLAVVSFDPLSTGVMARPGDYGADIAVAEGQGLGIPLQFGGPFLGLFACRSEFVRKMPGRLIGETLDRNGRKCFSLNLQAREQHIRRDKATSNICTNQGLMAVRATVYLSLLGPQGLRELAELCCQKAHYLADQLVTVPGVQLAYAQPFFKEFALRIEGDVAAKLARLRSTGFDVGPRLAGMTLAGDTAEGAGLLVAVTEKRTRAELDALVAAFRGVV